MNPNERRKWYCLTIPKWYADHPNIKSKAWFTEHGFEKYRFKMLKIIDELEYYGWEVRIQTAETLDNIVMKGKTQVITSTCESKGE
jgi:hypothetical protein